MAYFPFMVDIKGMHCLVVGGGRIALHKVKILQDFDVYIKLVAQEICQELKAFEGELLHFEERTFRDDDVEGMDFVIAATNQEALNYHVSDLCRHSRIPINAVDMKEACSFIFPAMVRNQDLLIAISSGGQSPAAVSYVKDKIQRSVPEYYGEMIETLGGYRDLILEHVDDSAKRKRLFYELLEYGDSHGGNIPEQLVRQMVQKR
ncbi:MAG: bifunctional precorrin-2 dehydrogenase/sirohydrochlorin ferrochelatase [Lachnospiraceae bacterium]|nr:bifunctional precorrin-2 dehydrogenase/sirohydrochlorin ferrochelatase [Lachnospiraceae bacterium]